ncbi:MAG: hypothetical protein QOI64_227 [Solirubrobacteraceae bacterium]|nr:hypothetical protein [Solirubrobacteraceae bacterium]
MRRRRRAFVAASAVAAAVMLFGLLAGYRGAQAGSSGKAALLAGESALAATELPQARRQFRIARGEFATMRRRIDGAGPLVWLARIVPVARKQVRGYEAFADAGRLLSVAGLRTTDRTESLFGRHRRRSARAGVLPGLDGLDSAVRANITLLEQAIARVGALNGYRLLGPLGSAREDLAKRLPELHAKARSTEQFIEGARVFMGGSGERRYLFFSQNPEEPRPTGGYLGTYGIIDAARGRLSLRRFEGTEQWYGPRPEVAIPASRADAPFPYIPPPAGQSLANLNAIPDWPTVARSAMRMWRRGGEAPVDGVLSVSTGFLVRVLGVIGPVKVPDFGETVSAANAVARMNFHTHQRIPERKVFVGSLARAVLAGMLAAPIARWQALGTKISEAFDAREAMFWTTDERLHATLGRRGWDGRLPATVGDFFREAPFAFETKNGRGIKRSYRHTVELARNGSARITTRMTFANTEPPGRFNRDTNSYLTFYGPEGAALDEQRSEPPVAIEPTRAGHPAAGWFRAAPPHGETTLRIAWNVPALLQRRKDGTWRYALTWQRIPDHSGDVVQLDVRLPAGWRWKSGGPPGRIDLTADFAGSWIAQPPQGS